MESVILETPVILCGFTVALVLTAFTVIKKVRLFFGILSATIFVITATFSLFYGAALYEVALCAVVFFAVSMLPLCRKGDK